MKLKVTTDDRGDISPRLLKLRTKEVSNDLHDVVVFIAREWDHSTYSEGGSILYIEPGPWILQTLA
jgi:hypothetical protein